MAGEALTEPLVGALVAAGAVQGGLALKARWGDRRIRAARGPGLKAGRRCPCRPLLAQRHLSKPKMLSAHIEYHCAPQVMM